MRRFEIRCDDAVVGFSDFESADESIGIRFGRFVAASGYAEFQSRFAQEQEMTETLALPLSVFHSGTRVPTRWVHVVDFSADLGQDTGIEVFAQLPDYETYRALFRIHAEPCAALEPGPAFSDR